MLPQIIGSEKTKLCPAHWVFWVLGFIRFLIFFTYRQTDHNTVPVTSAAIGGITFSDAA